MIDITPLAFSIYSNKGVYALLLGSGLSRPSGIPTGWEIVIDLIIQVAKANNETIEPCNAEKWYQDNFNKKLGYSSLLDNLTKTPTERLRVICRYIEPTEEEHESGLKEPTKAHRAIARMAKNGFLKVVITTNFDRLLEKAFDEIGITPQVICHADDIETAIPLIHAQFTIIKINGDYKDSRFLNTEEELKDYSDKWNEYLLRIFDEFGLITCGWSAVWDKALVELMRKGKSQKYHSYFLSKGACGEPLSTLARNCKGTVWEIDNADSFFENLNGQLEALSSIGNNRPISQEIAVARLKKYIAKSEYLILFNDLLEAETERAHAMIAGFEKYDQPLTLELFDEIVKLHTSAIENLLPMCIHAVRWSQEEHIDPIVNVIKRLSNYPRVNPFMEETLTTHFLSSLLLLYTVGLACITFKKFSLLLKLFEVKIPDELNRWNYLIYTVNTSLIEKDKFNGITKKNIYTPLSTWICERIKGIFHSFIPNEREYEASFCIHEYMLALNYAFIIKRTLWGNLWVPIGRFIWQRTELARNPGNPYETFFQDAAEQKDEWPPLKAGMFGGKYENYEAVKKQVDIFLTASHWR